MNRFTKAITNERIALIFLLKLLLLGCVVKSFFFFYNYTISNGWQIENSSDVFNILRWSVYYDAVCIAIVSFPFFIVALLPANKKILLIGSIIATTLTVFSFLLNMVDVFYFPFHRQRADADLLHVLRNPFVNSSITVWLIIIGILLFIFIAGKYLLNQYKKIISLKLSGQHFIISFVLLLIIIASLFIGSSKKMIPTRPLTDLSATQLPLAQNSFHSFFYSIYRSKEFNISAHNYMPLQEQERLISIHKKNSFTSSTPKNIVLFIMESVPYEFFDSSSKFKPSLPFMDSLINHSTFYSNAFSYSYNSNKGITAILTGIPTITDIPLYHSGFAGIPKTDIGTLLKTQNYHSSFFIGDNYDDFGFAKCCNWTGIQQYFCMENIPDYKQMEKHTMGLQDEYVLHFMQQKLQQTQQPFFSSFYNISTHYPNDLTKDFEQKTSKTNLLPPAKSMMYYDECLKNFFVHASKQPWYNNTVFIFCSDHWASPDYGKSKEDMVNTFRIPVIIFDPSDNNKKIVSNTVSQLDIMNTVAAYADINREIISYGTSLLDAGKDSNRVVFTKINNSIYQAINNEYVLGFNADAGQSLYCYQYKTDSLRKNNLIGKNPMAELLEKNIKAFLQTTSNHYRYKK